MFDPSLLRPKGLRSDRYVCCDGNLFSWCICSAAFEVDGVNETMATHRRKMR